MQTSTPNLSLRRILINDYLAFLGWFTPVIMWIVYLISVFIGRHGINSLFTYLTIAASIAGPVILLLRVITFRWVFAQGIEAPGKISDVIFMRDRGRVTFNYIYNGAEYTSASTLHRSAETRALKIGQTITVMVNPRNPKNGFVKELYTNDR